MELLRGTMDRHAFIAYRDDCPREPQPIVIRRRLLAGLCSGRIAMVSVRPGSGAAGVSAALINPAHTYPDLALFIDAAQERLSKAIDGERSVGEILQAP